MFSTSEIDQQQEGCRKPPVSDEDWSHSLRSQQTDIIADIFILCAYGGSHSYLILLIDGRHGKEQDISWTTQRHRFHQNTLVKKKKKN